MRFIAGVIALVSMAYGDKVKYKELIDTIRKEKALRGERGAYTRAIKFLSEKYKIDISTLERLYAKGPRSSAVARTKDEFVKIWDLGLLSDTQINYIYTKLAPLTAQKFQSENKGINCSGLLDALITGVFRIRTFEGYPKEHVMDLIKHSFKLICLSYKDNYLRRGSTDSESALENISLDIVPTKSGFKSPGEY